MTLEALQYDDSGDNAVFKLLDQRELPLKTLYIDISGPNAAFDAIKDMAVRGAPAIAIAGALALAVDLHNKGRGAQFSAAEEAESYINEQMAFLVTSRPTAVNLSEAAKHLQALAKREASAPGASGKSVTAAAIAACKQMLVDDVAANQAMGEHGADAMVAEVEKRGSGRKQLNVLTHCNTGSLATAGFGTALGVVRVLHAQGHLQHVYCTETRPYNQGARLTAFELVHDGLPATLIADSAAASLMAAGRVDAVVVGADRVTANGDTANKIGTYSLAVNAARHKCGVHCSVPFYVAAPTTTLDASLASGDLIHIEERDPRELTHHQGRQVAAPGIKVWNPSFDVTPADLITGIITEKGLVPRAADSFQVASLTAPTTAAADESVSDGKGSGQTRKENGHSGGDSHGSTIPGFYALDLQTVKDYLSERPELCKHLGPKETQSEWKVREVGDGNINYVYIVEGPAGGVVVKQGLPYIRIAHDWPLTQERARIEANALAEEAKHCPEHVPALYCYDPKLALIVMQYLAPPHDILRRALVAGDVFPKLSAHVATFLARTLFNTSLFALDSKTYREMVVKFQNTDLCRLTEQVIFTDPYYQAPVNRHTTPQLDAEAVAMRGDVKAKAAATRLKAIFCERQQALLHGDLHTGSFMVTSNTTYAIDAEFAFYGPMAFDVCKMIANLLIAFFAADGLEEKPGARLEQKQWIQRTIEEIWEKFREEFTGLWNASPERGDLIHAGLFSNTDGQVSRLVCQEVFFRELFQDTLSFAGAVIIRRILGIAHVIDFETIKDADVRAACEKRALSLGRDLLVNHSAYKTIRQVTGQLFADVVSEP